MRKIVTIILAVMICLSASVAVYAADWDEGWDKTKDQAGEYDEWYDYRYDPGRSFDGEHSFSTLGSGGVIYVCYSLGGDEAVLYEVNTADGGELEVPETIHDAVSGIDRKIVGIIARAELNQKHVQSSYKTAPLIFTYNYGNLGLTKLSLPSTIRFIGRGAFYGFDKLTSVTFKSRELIVERQAFRDCTALTKVDFGNVSNLTLEARAFMNCTGLDRFDFPKGSTVSKYAITGCVNVESLTNSPGSLNIGTLDGKSSKLKYVSVAEGAETIGGFSTSSLETVILPASVKRIEEGAFYNAYSLKNINLPSGLEYIGGNAFRGCRSLTIDVTVPEKVTAIDYIFYDSGITSITIPASVVSIYGASFAKCPNLKSITVENGCKNFKSADGVLYTTVTNSRNNSFAGWSLMKFPAAKGGSFTIPSDVVGLGGYAFEGCILDEITIPLNVEVFFTDYAVSLGSDQKSSDPFDNMKSKPTIWIYEHSEAHELVNMETEKYSVKFIPVEGSASENGSSGSASSDAPAPSVGAQFSDVTEKTVVPTSLKAINWAVDNGIVKGYSDNTFKPETICTREQFTIMLWRFAGEPASNASAVNKFTDVSDFSNNTSKKAVAWAVEQGVIKGFSDGSFQPKEDITRAQVAVMLWRFAGEKSVSTTSSKFSDISSYSSSVQNAIIWEESAGVASGYKDGTFKPDDGCQRQHMAIFLYRFNSKVDQYKPQG